MAYESKIDDLEIIQGDSSDIYFFGIKDGSRLDDGNWIASYAILENFGDSPIISRTLPLNSGTGEGDVYTPGTKFIFQITPSECAQLNVSKYIVAIQIENSTIPYKGEIAQFKLKVLPQGVI